MQYDGIQYLSCVCVCVRVYVVCFVFIDFCENWFAFVSSTLKAKTRFTHNLFLCAPLSFNPSFVYHPFYSKYDFSISFSYTHLMCDSLHAKYVWIYLCLEYISCHQLQFSSNFAFRNSRIYHFALSLALSLSIWLQFNHHITQNTKNPLQHNVNSFRMQKYAIFTSIRLCILQHTVFEMIIPFSYCEYMCVFMYVICKSMCKLLCVQAYICICIQVAGIHIHTMWITFLLQNFTKSKFTLIV